MKTYQVPKTDLTISRIGFSSASLAEWNSNSVTTAERARAERLIHTARECGITFFDHADVYGFGKSETIFGEVLRGSHGLRHDIVIQSKCGMVIPDCSPADPPIWLDLSQRQILNAAESSLERLGTDYLDVLLLHAPSTLVIPEEVAIAFDKLHESGKARYFGVSNFNASQIELLKKTVRQPLIINQIRLGLGWPTPLTDGMEFTLELAQATSTNDRYMGVSGAGTLDYCRLCDMQIQSWSPLRGLMLSHKPGSQPHPASTNDKLLAIAEAKHATPSAIALAWLLHHPAGIVPIVGTGNVDHLIDNCAADTISLSNQEWYELLIAAMDLKSRAMKES